MSKLFIVPTPIGNLEDITLRAINVLKSVDCILVEDTRKTGILLKHYQISAKLKSFHKMNEHRVVKQVVSKLASGKIMALVSNAGTPAISDPGYLLVAACVKNEIPVECLPGATALIPALVSSGLPTAMFYFEGFLPRKKGRQKHLKKLAELPKTFVIYESPNRLIKLLEELISYAGKDRFGSISREISKLYEEHQRGTLQELLQYFKGKNIKGEITVVIKGRDVK